MGEEKDDYKNKYQNLESEHQQLQSDYEQLQEDYNRLQSDYKELQTILDEHNSSFEKLQSQFEDLSFLLEQKNLTYDKLRAEYNLMISNYTNTLSELEQYQSDFEDLSAEYEKLESKYSQLATNRSEIYSLYNESLSNYEYLESRCSQLAANRSEIYTLYNKSVENYTQLEDEYDDLWDSYFGLYWNVSDFFYEMRTRNPYLWQRDSFITPDDPDVQDLLETILGDDADGDLTWSDMNKIYDFINDNKDYSYDPYMYYPTLHLNDSVDYYNFPEFWSYPNETIKGYNENGVFAGDCEDFTNLLISLLFAEQPTNNFTFGITLDTDPYNEGGGHATCFIRTTGNDIYIYDIAGNYKDGNKGSAEDTLEDYAYNWNWYGEVDIWSTYNPHCYKDFEDNDEFFDWWGA